MRRSLVRPLARRPARGGFTLIEIMIVIAIIGILTAAGYATMRELIPRYRTRKAAMDFANKVGTCRTLAVGTGSRCRVQLLVADPDLEELASNHGSYQVDVEMAGGTGWDVLPVDSETDATDDDQSEGLVDLDVTSPNGLKAVAIADWGALSGPGSGNSDAIVFDTRGFVSNPASDFGADGVADGLISVIFVNKVAEAEGAPDHWVVRISRAGLTTVDSERRATDGVVGSGGTASTTTADTTQFGSP